MKVSQYHRVSLEVKLSSVDKKEWKVTNFAWGKEEFTQELKLVYDFEGQIRLWTWDHLTSLPPCIMLPYTHKAIFKMLYFCMSLKAMAPHSSTLAWKIPWAEEPGGLQSMGSLGVRHD